jgi:putative transposase
MPRRRYPSDLTDAQWARLEPLLPLVRPGGRPRAHPLREVIDALRYVLRGGIAWRALPHDYPPWQTVYHYFRWWRRDGTWERLNDELRELVRVRAGRHAQPSAAILDSQSVETTEKGGSGARMGPRKSTGASGICSSIPSA